jgi:hypothetical protein
MFNKLVKPLVERYSLSGASEARYSGTSVGMPGRYSRVSTE